MNDHGNDRMMCRQSAGGRHPFNSMVFNPSALFLSLFKSSLNNVDFLSASSLGLFKSSLNVDWLWEMVRGIWEIIDKGEQSICKIFVGRKRKLYKIPIHYIFPKKVGIKDDNNSVSQTSSFTNLKLQWRWERYYRIFQPSLFFFLNCYIFSLSCIISQTRPNL